MTPARWTILGLALAVGAVGGILALQRARDGADPASWVTADTVWGEVAGKVTDAGGAPVPEAVVLAQNLRGFGGRATTDAHGAYRLVLMRLSRLEPPWPGRSRDDARIPVIGTTLYLAARADGYCGSTGVELTVRRGAAAPAPALKLWRGGYVRGRTLDTADKEVEARVRVAAHRAPDRPPRGFEGVGKPYPETFVPSEPGRGYEVGPIVPGEVELWATAPGVGGGRASVVVEEGETRTIDLRVKTTFYLAGKVVGPNGRGVGGVRVLCRREGATPPPRGPSTETEGPAVRRVSEADRALKGPRPRLGKRRRRLSRAERAKRRGLIATDTDAEGLFRFYALREGTRYALEIVGARAFPGATLSGLEPSREGLALKLPPRFEIQATVTEAGTRKPVEGCVVTVLPEATARYMTRKLRLGLRLSGAARQSDAAGHVVVPGLFPELYRITFLRAGYEVEQRTVAVDAADGVVGGRLSVELRRAGAVQGVVRDPEGRPARGAWVEARVAAPARPLPGTIHWTGQLRARTDRDGAFRLAGLPARETLSVRARDARGNAGRAGVKLHDSETLELALRLCAAARLVVRVRPRRAGALDDHPIRLIGIDDIDLDMLIRTDEAGLGRISQLPPGRYEVRAVDPREDVTRPAVRSRIREVVLEAGGTQEIDFEIPDITGLTGQVLLDGHPVAVAEIGFGPIEGTPDHFRALLFDFESGTFNVRVPPGTYHVHVRTPNRRFELPRPVVVPAAASHRLDIALSRR